MKPIKKKFTNLGNSKGIVLDKIMLNESNLDKLEEIEVECRKDKIIITKPKDSMVNANDKWYKLKEYLINTLQEKKNSPKYFKFEDVLEKMIELEKGE